MRNEPGVDLIITVCKEAVDIVLDSVRAACNLDYPTSKLRVIVSDDGSDIDLALAIEELRIEYPFLHYWSRPKRTPNGFKAGNMNDTVRMLASQTILGRPQSLDGQMANPVVAILDADMIVDKAMLRALVAHISVDNTVALVTVPQVCTLYAYQTCRVITLTF